MLPAIDPMVFFYLTCGAFLFLVVSFVLGIGHHGGLGHGGGGHSFGHGLGHGGAGHGGGAGHLGGSAHAGGAGHAAAAGGHAGGAGASGPAAGGGSAHAGSHVGHAQAGSNAGGKPGNMNVFSLQSILLFIAGFGIGGYFADVRLLGMLLVMLWAAAAGVVMGGIGYGFMNMLYRRQGSSECVPENFIGQIAEVMVSIPAGGRGKIICRLPGEVIETFSARADAGERIPVRAQVRIVGSSDSVVTVEPLNELEPGADSPASWRN